MVRRTMSVTATLMALATAVAGLVVGVWGDRRPYQPGQAWRPWKLVMALSLTAIMVLAGHLVTLLSGTPFRGRSGL